VAVATQHADIQASIANDEQQNTTAVQLESVCERINILEQLCEQLGECANKVGDFDEHLEFVVNTFERTNKEFGRQNKLIVDTQAQVSRMEEILVNLQDEHQSEQLERVQKVVQNYIDPRLLDIGMTHRGKTAELLERVNLHEKDTVLELNVLQSRIHALENRRKFQPSDGSATDARATDREMIDARLSALEDRVRREAPPELVNIQVFDELYARVHSLEVSRSWPNLEPKTGTFVSVLSTASRLARQLAQLVVDARTTLGSFLAGAVFAFFWTIWLLSKSLHLASADIGSLNMLHCERVNTPNTLKHGSNLKAAADTRDSSLFDGGATHIVHGDDDGAIPGSWKPDVASLRLSDDTFIPAFGSVLKDFIPPHDVGGPDIRRRVLIAPEVAYKIWSGTQEVDMYGSTFVDSPIRGKHLQLEDGRILKLRLASNGLRMIDLSVRPTEAVNSNLVARIGKRHLPLGTLLVAEGRSESAHPQSLQAAGDQNPGEASPTPQHKLRLLPKPPPQRPSKRAPSFFFKNSSTPDGPLDDHLQMYAELTHKIIMAAIPELDKLRKAQDNQEARDARSAKRHASAR
jgi:hypothetical protein